jgi:uncharacterized protein YndB with AHSA1/START domain
MSTIKLEKFIQAPSSELFLYFTNSTALRDWMCDVATTDPHPGGHLYMCWRGDYYTSGEYVKVEKDNFVSFTWLGKGEPRQTLVEVTLKRQKGGTLLKLAHRGIGKGQKWASIADVYQKEWQSAFENLSSVLENGPDLRITKRPMLGILTGDFDAKIAAKMGIPLDYGLRVNDVVDGMGAQKAGIQADDVIVAVDGHDLTDGNTFTSIISTKHAGDCVEVTFYRDSEKKLTNMTLSGRPIPVIPASSIELSKQLKPIYHQFETEIETLLDSVTEEECKIKPGVGEWSVNEVLAHLIHSELGWQNFISEMIGGYEGAYDGFGGNIQAHIDGTIATYPTKVKLFNELKIHDTETLSLVAHIPEEFSAHKGKFWKLVFQASQNPYHLQSHLDQMRIAINSAREN